MLETSVSVCGLFAISYLMNGIVPQRSGNSNPSTAPSDVLRTKDSYLLVICSTNAQFHNLCRALGRPEMIEDPRFENNAARLVNRAAMREAIESALITRSTAEWSDILERAGAPCGAINRMDMVFDDPQILHRGVRVDVPYGDGTTVPVLRSPLRFSETPVRHGSPPMLGEYTEKVLGEVLGKSREQLDVLRAAKVI